MFFDVLFSLFFGGGAKTQTKFEKYENDIRKTRSDSIRPGSTQKAASTHTIPEAASCVHLLCDAAHSDALALIVKLTAAGGAGVGRISSCSPSPSPSVGK